MRVDFRIAILALSVALPLSAQAQTAPAQPKFADRFAAANTTHDGCLTQAQAQAGGMKGVAKQFAMIDTTNHGCVTIDQIKSYNQTRKAQMSPPAPAPQQ